MSCGEKRCVVGALLKIEGFSGIFKEEYLTNAMQIITDITHAQCFTLSSLAWNNNSVKASNFLCYKHAPLNFLKHFGGN